MMLHVNTGGNTSRGVLDDFDLPPMGRPWVDSAGAHSTAPSGSAIVQWLYQLLGAVVCG